MSFIHISNLLLQIYTDFFLFCLSTQIKQRSLSWSSYTTGLPPPCSPGRNFNNFCSNILTRCVFLSGFSKPSCIFVSKSQNQRRVEAGSDLWKLPKHRQLKQVACDHAQPPYEYLQGQTHSGQSVSSVQTLSHWKVSLKFICVALCFTPVLSQYSTPHPHQAWAEVKDHFPWLALFDPIFLVMD